ncbi:hypothetical protein [Nonomuraea sp. NPDC049758]|uniref:hypothetical protein n=1 Tax=Nonomuraea sp. NPDC049758 TaxID=3154360 RepID=UPI00341F14C9
MCGALKTGLGPKAPFTCKKGTSTKTTITSHLTGTASPADMRKVFTSLASGKQAETLAKSLTAIGAETWIIDYEGVQIAKIRAAR